MIHSKYFSAKRVLVLACLLNLSVSVKASKPPKLSETSDKIFQIADGLIIVPVRDSRDQLTRPDLRRDADEGSSPLPADFQTTFFDHEGLQKYPFIWIFSPSSGKIGQVKSTDLKMGEPDWGVSTGVLENIRVSAGTSKIDCEDSDCLAIVAPQIPFKSDHIKPIEFSDPPRNITAQTVGIQESDFDAVRLNYSKRPSGAEIVVVQSYRKDSQARCGGGGVTTMDTGFVRTGGSWYEVYSKYGEMETTDLTKPNVAKFGRPTASFGVPATGDEVISIESTFIFLNKKSASMTPIRKPSIGVCGC